MVKEISLSLKEPQNQARQERPKNVDSDTVLQAIETN